MPLSKTALKTAIKELKNQIKNLNNDVEAKLSYSQMKADIEEIYKINDEAERNAAITNYEHTLRDRLAEHLLTRRSFIHSSRALLDANDKKNITRASITYVSKAVRLLVGKACSLYEDDYLKNHEFNEEKATKERDWELAKLKERTFHSETTVFFYKWDRKCVRNEIDDFNEATRNLISNNYVFSGEYNNGEGSAIIFADAYYKAMLMRAELERTKNDKLWRFFNFLKVASYRDYISTVERALEKVGFKESEHGAGAIEALKNTVIQPHGIDMDNVKDKYKSNMNWISAQKIKETRIARDHFEKANKLDRNPMASCYSKIKDILEKYNISKEAFTELTEKFCMSDAARKYDTLKDVEAIKESAGLSFLRTLNELIKGTIILEKELDIKELLNDAAKISETAMEHYLGISKIEELQNLDRPIYAFTISLEGVENTILKHSSGISVEDEKNPDEYKRIMPLPGTIDKAAKEVTEIVNGWVKKPENQLNNEPLEEIQEQKEENQLKIDIKAKRKPLTNEERELANEMLKIDFRPSAEKIKEQLAIAKAITLLFDESDTMTKESQGVFRANKSKLMHLKKALDNGESQDQLNKEFDTSEKLLNAKYTEYKPQRLEEIEKERVQVNMDAPNENKNEIINDNAPFINEQEKNQQNQIDEQIKEMNPVVK